MSHRSPRTILTTACSPFPCHITSWNSPHCHLQPIWLLHHYLQEPHHPKHHDITTHTWYRPKPRPRTKAQVHPPPSEQHKQQASNADQLPSKQSCQASVEDDHSDIVEGEGADLGQWPKIEEELVSKVKGKGIWGWGGKKAPMRRYIIWYYFTFFLLTPFSGRLPRTEMQRMLPRKPPQIWPNPICTIFLSFIP